MKSQYRSENKPVLGSAPYTELWTHALYEQNTVSEMPSSSSTEESQYWLHVQILNEFQNIEYPKSVLVGSINTDASERATKSTKRYKTDRYVLFKNILGNNFFSHFLSNFLV